MKKCIIIKSKRGAILSESYSCLTSSQKEKLTNYTALLDKWNKVFNLIGPDEVCDNHLVLTHHILDALALIPSLGKSSPIIDVGSGAGFPGIPLAIACPDKHFVLLDSNGKKTRFLFQVVLELGLKNIQIEKTRVENYKPPHLFSTVITRAFAPLTKMLLFTEHLVDETGVFMAMKGKLHPEELADVPKRFRIEQMIALQIPGLEEERHLICIKKIKV